MSNKRMHTLVFVAVCLAYDPANASVGPGEAAARSSSHPSDQRVARRADFKVAVWYRKRDSLGTFKYEIYDVRKGEFTASVDAWARDVQARFPGYYVVVRDVDLTREKGETDLLKVGAVIDRELAVAAALAGIAIGLGPRSVVTPFFGLGGGGTNNATHRAAASPRSSAGNRDYLNPSPVPFPIPVPFPRLPR